MLKTSAIVVGAGHCGLAMSRCLADRSIDHVVLERSEVAHSWRTQRWDSLRLLTPNWMTRLPGYSYRGDDPDGYLAAPDVGELIAGYAKESAAPVRANTTVTSVRQAEGGYVVQTDQDVWHTRSVVLAPGASTVPKVPALQGSLPSGITTLTPLDYRNPSQLPDGGVLVVGEHVRMPRRSDSAALTHCR
jgi:putative flavoprotein involved in K+ transport